MDDFTLFDATHDEDGNEIVEYDVDLTAEELALLGRYGL